MNETPETLNEEEIAALAKQIWEEEGQPEGKAEEHWTRAQEQLLAARGEKALAEPGEKTGTVAAD